MLHHQNKTLEQMTETLFRQWFVEEAGEDWGEVTFDDVLTISSSKRIFYKEYEVFEPY
jgi:type I restriction enzyme S subunit